MNKLPVRILAAALPSLAGCLLDTYLVEKRDGGSADVRVSDEPSPDAPSVEHHAWSKRLDLMAVFSGAPRVALDRAGNAYVWAGAAGPVDLGGGPLGRSTELQYILASFAPDGALRWAHGFPLLHGVLPGDVATDDAGNVYVAGGFVEALDIAGAHLVSAGSTDVVVASFTGAGAPRWAHRFGGADPDFATRVRVDPEGHVDVIGQFNGSIDFGGGPLVSAGAIDVFLASFAGDGAYRWARRAGGDREDFPTGLGVASDGTIIVGGYYSGTGDFGGGPMPSMGVTSESDVFVASYTADGAHRWSRRYGSSESERLGDLAVNARGDVFLVGVLRGPTDFGGGVLGPVAWEDVFVASLERDGAHRWSQRYGTDGADRANAVALDASGNVYVTGDFNWGGMGARPIALGGASLSSPGQADVFVASYTGGGAHRWSRAYGTALLDAGTGIVVDPHGDVLVVGSFGASGSVGGSRIMNFESGPLESITGGDAFLARLVP